MKRKSLYTLLMCVILACASAAIVACGKKDKCAAGHTYDEYMVCTVCGYCPYTLSYDLNNDRESYAVVGLSSGPITEEGIEIRIPPTYCGLPVTEISGNAFARHYYVTSITIPQSVTSIGAGLFSGCDSLREITVASDNPKYHSAGNCLIETATKTLIAGCKNSIVPTDGSITNVGDRAFYNCSSLTSIEIPQQVTSIGDHAFSDCSKLTSITIPQSVTSIGSGAFSSCVCLTIYCEAQSAASGFDSNWSGWYYPCPVVWNCKNNDKDADGYAYAIIDGVRYSLKDGIATVIRQLSDLSGSVTIPSSVIYKSASYTATSIASSAFEDCALSGIGLPSSITSIARRAFRNCGHLSAITIPQSVTSIEWEIFEGCDVLSEITVANGNPKYHSTGNCIIETSTKTLIAGCKNSIIPTDGSVTSIGRDAFSGCSSLTSISIPQGVTSIGSYAFFGCGSLTNITIPSSVTSIGSGTFWYCRSLTSISIPQSVTSIGGGAFEACSKLTSITIPNGVTSIGDRAFSDCSSLTSITIPNSVTSIGGGAFSGCESLTSITIPQGVTSIGDDAFFNCRKLTSITIPQVTSIEKSAFEGCIGLTDITIPQSVTSIRERAFHYCSSLTSITYGGTKAQWEAIGKQNWNYNTGNYTITCTDGTLSKSES
ncbi:MAG: leucine-rich repeat domain-containing protein [Clostridiales bacterium]|nr:leucine-rich repeat domain-containing protein [Clostridiales bacterium]